MTLQEHLVTYYRVTNDPEWFETVTVSLYHCDPRAYITVGRIHHVRKLSDPIYSDTTVLTYEEQKRLMPKCKQ